MTPMDLTGFEPIPYAGFEHLYLMNRDGMVYSVRMGRLIRPSSNNKGFLMVYLTPDNKAIKSCWKSIGRMVLEKFIPIPPELSKFYALECRYKNGIKTDNRADNLEWTTHSDAITRAYAEGERTKGNCGRPTGFEHSKETRELMSMAKKRPVVVEFQGGMMEFDGVSDLLQWDGFPFKMYRKLFNRALSDYGGVYRGFKFYYKDAGPVEVKTPTLIEEVIAEIEEEERKESEGVVEEENEIIYRCSGCNAVYDSYVDSCSKCGGRSFVKIEI